MKEKKPIIFLILKIVGVLGIGLAVFGFVLAIKGFGDFESNNFMIGAIITPFGFMLGVGGLVIGFRPEITKASVKTAKYIQAENKEDLTQIATQSAEIASEAVTITAEAVKAGLEDKMFCKHCGAEIDSDSVFCNKCGGKQ